MQNLKTISTFHPRLKSSGFLLILALFCLNALLPGTAWATARGQQAVESVEEGQTTIEYNDAPLHEREYVILTLPEMTDVAIPEMVQGAL